MATPPVTPAEKVCRQAKGGNPIFYDPDRTPPIRADLFLPSRSDRDGLSLIRLSFRSEVWAAFRPQTGRSYALVRLLASELTEFGRAAGFPMLHFDPSPDELDEEHGIPWAHFVVREINRVDYEGDEVAERRIKEWTRKLERRLTTSDVMGPFRVPDVEDAYRPPPGRS